MQNLTQLVNDAKDTDKLLSKRTELTNELSKKIIYIRLLETKKKPDK